MNKKLLYFYKVFNQYRNDFMWNEVTDAEYLRKVFNKFCKMYEQGLFNEK